jgi:hypothetical protein
VSQPLSASIASRIPRQYLLAASRELPTLLPGLGILAPMYAGEHHNLSRGREIDQAVREAAEKHPAHLTMDTRMQMWLTTYRSYSRIK